LQPPTIARRNDRGSLRPFDPSTLARLGLYPLIPIGSWVGGTLVELLIDRVLE